MRYLFIAISVVCIGTNGIAQDNEMKWGKIPKADLAMKTYAADPEAGAVILGDYGVIEYNLRASGRPLKTERHVRIKFLTQAGIDQRGDVTIRYYTHDNAEVITNLKAQVYLPDGTEIEAGKENIFTTKENDYWTTEKISFPGLQVGAIAEYRYTISSNSMFNPVDWYFQQEIPIVISDLQINLPEWYEYVILKQGHRLDIDERKQTGETLTYTNTERSGDYNVQHQHAMGTYTVNVNNWHYAAKNVPALKEESHITTMNDYYSHVRFQLQSVSFPSSPTEVVLNSWQKVEEELLEREWFGKEYNADRNGTLVLEAAGVSAIGSTSQAEIARKLYDFISEEYRWDGNYSIGMIGTIPEMLKKKEGTSGSLNLTLLAGLLQLGIDAAPVLVSTRHHRRTLELYPFVDQFNHVMVVATLDGKGVFMDIANARHPMGLPRENSLNYRGWMVRKGTSQWIDVIPEQSKATYYYQLTCAPDASLSGSVQGKATGYFAQKERGAYLNKPEDYFRATTKSGSHSWEASDLQVQNAGDKYQAWSFTSKVSGTRIVEPTDFIYLSPVFTMDFTENPFKAESRSFPVEFNYPYAYKVIIDIVMPQGYVVETLPPGRKLQSEDGGIVLTYRSGENAGKIQLIFDFSLTKVRYEYDQYLMLKQLFNEIGAIASEQVVLKKAT